jgi:hypothetical protein
LSFITATKFVLCGIECEYLVLGMNFSLQIFKRMREVFSFARLCRVCEMQNNTQSSWSRRGKRHFYSSCRLSNLTGLFR